MITVIGDLLLDVFVLSELQEEEQGAGLVFRGGGSAANTASWLARLGQQVSFVGCVGSDAVGGALVSELTDGGVLTQIRRVDGKETGGVSIEVDNNGERVMRSSRGANESLSPKDILSAARFEPAWVHLTGYSLLGAFGLEILWAAHHLAIACDSRLSFDPSSAGAIQRCTAEALLESLRQNKVDLLLLNRDEAEALTGIAESAETANVLAREVSQVIVKEGRKGCSWAGQSTGRMGAYPLKAVDTTGAGDAFNAGVLNALARDKDVEEGCRAGQACAVEVLQGFGGRPGREDRP